MKGKKNEKISIMEICPIRNVVARFGNKWALLLIVILNENANTRFNQIRKLVPDISTKMLSNTLQILEADGLVKRKVFPEVPIRIEYTLSERGKSLVPIINTLTEWAKQNMAEIITSRKNYEKRHKN
jgi:DNA-binding HxlR family transcriptional regulator